MVFYVWIPHHSNPLEPTALALNFFLDGVIYMSCILLYFIIFPKKNREKDGFKADLKSSWKRYFLAIVLHCFVGYIVDYLIFENYERVVIHYGYKVTPLSEVLDVWLMYFLFLILCQGLLLGITLHHRFARYKINIILGSILFGLLTNPMNLTLHYYINYWT